METRYLDISGARNPHVLDRCKGVAHIVYRSVYCRGRVGRDSCCNKGSNDPRQSLPVAHSEKGILRLCKGVAPHSRTVESHQDHAGIFLRRKNLGKRKQKTLADGTEAALQF